MTYGFGPYGQRRHFPWYWSTLIVMLVVGALIWSVNLTLLEYVQLTQEQNYVYTHCIVTSEVDNTQYLSCNFNKERQ